MVICLDKVLFAYGPADVTAIPKPCHCFIKIQIGFYLSVTGLKAGCPGKEAVKLVFFNIFLDYCQFVYFIIGFKAMFVFLVLEYLCYSEFSCQH